MAKQKLTAADEKAIIRFGLDRFDRNDPDKAWVRTNPFSGAEVHLNTFTKRLVDIILDLYGRYERGDFKAVKDYDRMKLILLKLDSDTYYKLID